MKEHIIRDDQGNDWNLHLRRPLNDWEGDLLMDLLRRLNMVQPGAPEDEDSRVWEANLSGIFSVKSCCRLLMSNEGRINLIQTVWKLGMCSKVSFLLWLVYWGRVLAVDNLMKWGFSLENRCCMCCSELETNSHLFIHCQVALSVWAFFIDRFRRRVGFPPFNGVAA